ncbi:MAG: recombinase family protein [Staphylococcus epidermidis]|nr:recombinase family protein [Staphylococcus epidermidis]
MSKIGYARVSTKEQNLSSQIEYLKQQGVSESLIFIDKGVSGTIRPMNEKALKSYCKNPVAVMYSLFIN